MDGDVGRSRLLDVENQQQRFGGPSGGLQRDLAEHHELRLVDAQVDDHVDLERNTDVEGDHLAHGSGHPWIHDPDLGGHLGELARALGDGPNLEGVSRDRGDRSADSLFADGDVEELAAEFFIGHVVVGVHGALTVSRPTQAASLNTRIRVIARGSVPTSAKITLRWPARSVAATTAWPDPMSLRQRAPERCLSRSPALS